MQEIDLMRSIRIEEEYDMRVDEAQSLVNLARIGTDGIWSAIYTAYKMGYSAGKREVEEKNSNHT